MQYTTPEFEVLYSQAFEPAFRLRSPSSMTGMAQQNIKAAFEAIINSSDADISASHSLQRDPDTKVKTGQDDIYKFVLPAKKMPLIKKALAAFEKDIPDAYSVESGKNTSSGPKTLLHSEQTGYGGISIDDPGCDYIYALFLPSKTEDPNGIYRYAYGLNYKEEDGRIVGKLIINYATTLKHRQSAYDQNKNTVRQLFKTLRSDKNYSYDPILGELLRQCELGIK